MGTYGVTNPVWTANVYTFDNDDPVQGGSAGTDNKPLKELANNCASLKQFKSNVIQGALNPNDDSSINSLTALQTTTTYAIQSYEVDSGNFTTGYITSLLYFNYLDGTFWRFNVGTGNWENFNDSINFDLTEIRINKDGNLTENEKYYSLKTETIDGEQKLVLREFPGNQLGDLVVDTIEANVFDGTAEVTNIVDKEVLLLANNTDENNQDAQFAIKRLLDIGATLDKINTDVDVSGLGLSDPFGFDKFTIIYDGSNGPLSTYIDPDSFESYFEAKITDTGYADIAGYYRVAKVVEQTGDEYLLYTYRSFNGVVLETGVTEVDFSPDEQVLMDVSAMIQWVNSPLETGDEDGYFQLVTRQGLLLGLNVANLAETEGDVGDVYSIIITNQAQFDTYFTSTFSSSNEYVIVKPNRSELSGGYYNLDHLVEFTGNNNTIIFHDGARVKITHVDAGFKINCNDIRLDVNFDGITVAGMNNPAIDIFSTTNCDINTKIFNLIGDVAIRGTSNTTNVNLKATIDGTNTVNSNLQSLENVNCNDIYLVNDVTGGKNIDTCTNINIVGFVQTDAYIGYGDFDF